MKALPMLDHVMLWVARGMAFVLCLLFAWMIFLNLPSHPDVTEPAWQAISRDILFVGAIVSLFGLFQLRSIGIRFYLMAYSIAFVFLIISFAIADRIEIYNAFQRGEPFEFHYFWSNILETISHPLWIPILAPLAIFWAALRPIHPRIANHPLPSSY